MRVAQVVGAVVEEPVESTLRARTEIAIGRARVVSVSGEAFLGVPYGGNRNVKNGARGE